MNKDPPRHVPKQNVQTTQTISHRGSKMVCSNAVIQSNKVPSRINHTMTKVDVSSTLSQFEKVLKDNTKVAVHFTYSWSWRRQCRGISSKFAEGVVTYPKIKFLIVKIDENLDTAIKYHSTAMIFRFYIDGTEFSRLLFANEYKLNERLKELNDSNTNTSERIDDTFISSVCKSISCNPIPSNSDQKADPLYELLVELEKPLTPRNFDSRDDAFSIYHDKQAISVSPGLEWNQNIESNQIADKSNSISLKQSLYSDKLMQTDDPYISSKLSIDSMHTNASPLTGCMPHPYYNTFPSDSKHHKVDQVNNLSDYVPGKIISTHFYEQPPTRNFRSKYDVNNNSPYKHANNGASRHISRKYTKISQQRRKVRSNTRTQPSTVPNAMNSTYCYPSTIPRTQNAHISPHPTRRKSYCLSFCCICLFATLMVVFLISVVIIIVCSRNF